MTVRSSIAPRRPPSPGSLRFRQIDAGQNHTCARSYPEDYVYCWGQNDKGQLGDGTTTNRSTPVRVLGSRQFRQVAWATITPAASLQPTRPSVGVGIGVVDWGDSTEAGRRARPTLVAGGHLFRQVDAGRDVTCAVTTEDRASCWGDGRYGPLGNGKTYLSFWPRAVAGGLSFRRVTVGAYHVCGETTRDRAYCWGSNIGGGIGTGTLDNSTTPVALRAASVSLSSVPDGAARRPSRQAIAGEKTLGGTLGDGTRMDQLVPTAVVGPM